ncbi:MAG: ABC transporter ATP-binding protein [Clostridia bacterium]|nr:ABC transporter ATP-binding protein [Clostridia bacterium]
MIKKFMSYYRPHMRLFIIDLTCALLMAILNLVYPKIAGKIIKETELSFIFTWSGILLAVFVLKAVLKYVIDYWGHVVGVRIQGDMRKELFTHLQKLPFSYYDETKTGAIMNRIINDLFEVSELAHHGPEELFVSSISIIGALVMVCTINPYLSLIVLVIVPVLIFVASKLRLEMHRAFMASREKMSEINSAVESAVSGVRVSKAYTAEEHENARFQNANSGLMSARKGQYRAMAKFNTAMSFIMDFLYLVAFAAGGIFYIKGLISAGDLTSYVLYVAMLITPIRTFVTLFQQIEEGATGFKRFMEVMAVPEEKEREGVKEVEALKGDISFKGVNFRYKKTAPEGNGFILNGFDMDIRAGKTVALVGPSGGGKTTICNLIPRFYEIDGGSITIDGLDTRDISLFSLRKNVGIVAQDVFIFAGSIKDNIAYGDFSASDEEIKRAAKLANIDEFVSTLPDGYDTYVGERGVKLSGGQRQRIAIARAFLKNPPILILDEATSALDNVTELQIQEALERLSKGRTTLVVAHRLSTIKDADEIIVITEGKAVERGKHDELVAAGGVYAELVKARAV